MAHVPMDIAALKIHAVLPRRTIANTFQMTPCVLMHGNAQLMYASLVINHCKQLMGFLLQRLDVLITKTLHFVIHALAPPHPLV